MALGFDMTPKRQQEWGWLFAIYLFLGGTAGGLFLLSLVLGLPRFLSLLALGTMLFGGVVVLFELGSPMRLWRAFFRPGTSWVSRGILSVAVFLAAGFGSLSVTGPVADILGAVAGVCALVITLYPGFILQTTRAIPFWHTPFVPALFVVSALLSAAAVVLVAAPDARVGWVAVGLIVAQAALGAGYLGAMERAGGAARDSVRLLNTEPLAGLFRLGVIGLGVVLPLAVLLFLPAAAPLAGAVLLVGGVLLRYCVIKAGVFLPAGPIAANVDFSKLNRTSEAFQREYAAMASRVARSGS